MQVLIQRDTCAFQAVTPVLLHHSIVVQQLLPFPISAPDFMSQFQQQYMPCHCQPSLCADPEMTSNQQQQL